MNEQLGNLQNVNRVVNMPHARAQSITRSAA